MSMNVALFLPSCSPSSIFLMHGGKYSSGIAVVISSNFLFEFVLVICWSVWLFSCILFCIPFWSNAFVNSFSASFGRAFSRRMNLCTLVIFSGWAFDF